MIHNKYNLKFSLIIFILSLIILHSCQNDVNVLKERNLILKLHEDQRTFHFEKNINGLVNMFSPNFHSIDRGQISKPSIAESRSRFTKYFNIVDFIKWDDVKEPIVSFSNDGSMAYTIVNKLVVLSYENEKLETVLDTTYYSWVSVYKKYNKDWKLDCIVSTIK